MIVRQNAAFDLLLQFFRNNRKKSISCFNSMQCQDGFTIFCKNPCDLSVTQASNFMFKLKNRRMDGENSICIHGVPGVIPCGKGHCTATSAHIPVPGMRTAITITSASIRLMNSGRILSGSFYSTVLPEYEIYVKIMGHRNLSPKLAHIIAPSVFSTVLRMKYNKKEKQEYFR